MKNETKSTLLKANKNDLGRGEEAYAGVVVKEPEISLRRLYGGYVDSDGNHLFLTGENFEQVFSFLETNFPSQLIENLLAEVPDHGGKVLRGVSFAGAAKIVTDMPEHPGSEAIIEAMRSLNRTEIKELVPEVLMFLLEMVPDHEHAEEIAGEIVKRDFTGAYDFISRNPLHPETGNMIRRMFRKDQNLAILLLQEQMDHPQVEVIITGIYDMVSADVMKLTPNAILFILDVAPDHALTQRLIERLVHQNYIKAFRFVKDHMDYRNAEMMIKAIIKRKPELENLF